MPRTIQEFVDPVVGQTWGELNAVQHTKVQEGRLVHSTVELGYPIQNYESSLQKSVEDWLNDSDVKVDWKFHPPVTCQLPGAKNVIAVASGKGGVGKSTIAVNLSLGLARAGGRVGLLDADIYGPSQGVMLGIPEGKRPVVREGKIFEPVVAHGIETMSMSFLVSERTPMVWRGPMASGALQQMMKQTEWGDLDYLIVDMPPGHRRHSIDFIATSCIRRCCHRDYSSKHRVSRCSKGD